MTEERQTEEEAAAAIEEESIQEQNDLIRFAFTAGAVASFGEDQKFDELQVTSQALNLTVDVLRQLVMTDEETREKAATMMRERIEKINEKAKELEDAADAEKEVAEAKGESVPED